MLKGDSATRKPRLFVDSSSSKADEESDDPIAAVLAARKRTQGTTQPSPAVMTICDMTPSEEEFVRSLQISVTSPSQLMSFAEQALKAAAAAAAKAASANVITYFADDTPVKPHQGHKSGEEPACGS